jgi:hypothetical protein
VNFQIQLSKRVDAVPLTRNYLSEQKETRVEAIGIADLGTPFYRAPVNNGELAK